MNFLNNIDINVLKKDIIKGYNKKYNSEIELIPFGLRFDRLNDDKSILVDNETLNGLVIDKIDISELFGELDLSLFKDSFEIQTEELTPLEIQTLNNELGYKIVSNYESNFSRLSEYDQELLLRYGLFCKVTGFYLIDITDVYLSLEEDILTIKVNEYNNTFKGTIEVKTWSIQK